MKKKSIDERQKQELMRIERVGFWVLFLGSVVVVFVQAVFFQAGLAEIAGEIVLVFVGGIVFFIGCVKKGAWDYCTEPGIKTSLTIAVIGGTLCALVSLLIRVIRYNETDGGRLAAHAGIVFAAVFVILLVFYLLYGAVIKRRQKRLEENFDNPNNDDASE